MPDSVKVTFKDGRSEMFSFTGLRPAVALRATEPVMKGQNGKAQSASPGERTILQKSPVRAEQAVSLFRAYNTTS